MLANQNAHAFGLSFTVVRMKMKDKAQSHWLLHIAFLGLLLLDLFDLVLLGFPLLGCP